MFTPLLLMLSGIVLGYLGRRAARQWQWPAVCLRLCAHVIPPAVPFLLFMLGASVGGDSELLRVLLRFSLARKEKGQGCDDVSEEGAGALTDGERKAISDFAAKAVKELKRYRKKFGRFALLEASEKDGDFFRLLI